MRKIAAFTSLFLVCVQPLLLPSYAASEPKFRRRRQGSGSNSNGDVFLRNSNGRTQILRQTFVRIGRLSSPKSGTVSGQPPTRPITAPIAQPFFNEGIRRQDTANRPNPNQFASNTVPRGQSTPAGSIGQNVNPPPPRAQRFLPATLTDSEMVGRIVKQAVRSVRIEDRFLELRLLLGIDKTVNQFKIPEPRIFSESPLNVTRISRQGRIINWIGTLLRDFKLQIPISAALSHPEAVSANIACPYVQPSCDINAKYRTINGTCNNVNRRLLGSAFTPMAREMSPIYENDPLGNVDLPRTRGKLGPLPSARLVSTRIHSDRGAEESDTRWSQQLTLWGQMLAHDITDRAPGKGSAGAVMFCCDQRIKTPFCNGIEIPEGDLFRERGQTCMEFVRSAEVTDVDCQLGIREQLNQASSFIDAGFIYGVTEEKLRSLRAGTRGMLATSSNGHLPIIPHPNTKATLQGFALFATGDDRVNEHTGLMGIETLWVKEHNRIAEVLGGINPFWDDETVFQETRRVVSAIFQHITYSEYLPQIIGEATMTHYSLWPLAEGYYQNYSVDVDPSASNAFTTAVYRFGHSMIRNKFSLMDKSFNMTGSRTIPLKDTFFTSITFLEAEHTMMRGTMMDQSEPCDRMLSSDLINNLHQTRDGNGRDLAALNIQRGRDHGLPSYTSFRKHYGFGDITEFTNGTNGFVDHPVETTELFREVYSDPSDVDLWTGGVSELPIGKAAVGPLFANMIAQQFKKLKSGDRYFYESDAQPVPFTPDQLREIRKVTYASVLCHNLHFSTIQPEAFLLTKDSRNAKIPCTSIPSMDLFAWRENNAA